MIYKGVSRTERNTSVWKRRIMDILGFITDFFDLPILDGIAEHLHHPVLDILMPLFSLLADGGIFWILTACILLLIPKYRKTGLCMGAALLMGVLLCNMILKPLVARIRPYDYQLLHFGKTIALLIPAPSDYAFPSGHTIASFEAATVLFLRHKKAGIAALVLAGLIAFSRLYLYVHYPTDVLASIILGIAIAHLAWILTDRACTKHTKNKLQHKEEN